jgi:hypothetical protein
MNRLIPACLLAWGLVCTSLPALAVETSAYQDGDIEVTITTGPLPAELRNASGADDDWYGVTNLITRIKVKVGENQTIVPLRAFLGMTDPGAVEVKRGVRGAGWKLTISGGDASTSYHAVLDFVGVEVRMVRDYANEADRTHPYSTQVFTKPKALD